MLDEWEQCLRDHDKLKEGKKEVVADNIWNIILHLLHRVAEISVPQIRILDLFFQQ